MLRIAQFTKDLMNDAGLKVLLARENYTNLNFEDNLALVDDLPLEAISTNDSYNGATEVQSLTIFNKGVFTIDFYGADSKANALKFISLCRSQKAFDLSRSLKVSVNSPTSITDLKELVGTKYYKRYQVSFTASMCDTLDIETLRIDTAGIEYLINK